MARFSIPRRLGRRILPVALLWSFLVLFWSFSGPEAAQNGPPLAPVKISWKNNLLSVDAQGRTTGEVFDALSAATGVFTWVAPPARPKKLSARVDRLPLEKAVEALVPGLFALSFTGPAVSAVYVFSEGKNAASPASKRLFRLAENDFFSDDELAALVTAHVRQDRPSARLFARLPREDVTGRRVSLAFVFHDGPGPVPTVDETRRRVREAWAARLASRAATGAAPGREAPPMPPPLPDRFFTLETSADFSGPPVRTFHEGLPEEITQEPKASSLLASRLPTRGPFTPVRAFQMDLVATGFEFKAADGASLYVDIANKAVFTGFSAPAAPKPEPSQDLRREVLSQWTEFLSY